MQNRRRSEVRSFLAVLFFVLAPASALTYAQTLTLVRTGARSAGSGSPGFNSDTGSATGADINPTYLAIDSNGVQYLSDTQDNCVRKIDLFGNISTVAGLFVSSSSGDTCNTAGNPTPNSTQGLFQPAGLAIDSSNNLYIADSMHNCIRKLPSGKTGVANLTTVAGTCDSTNSATPHPSGLAVDAGNNLYVALQDTEANPALSTYQVLQLPATGTGLCLMTGAPSANVSATCFTSYNVLLSSPSGIAVDAIGDLFVADTGNNCVREVTNQGAQETPVGRCLNDGTGSSATALVNPEGLVFSHAQFLFISEAGPQNNNVVSFSQATKTISPVAGLSSGAPGVYSVAQDGEAAIDEPLIAPIGISVDSSDNLSIADSGNFILRKLNNSVLFPTTNVGSVSATSAITFSVNQNVNLSASIGSDFNITSNSCNGALTPSSTLTCQVIVSFAPTKPGIGGAALRLTDSLSNSTVAVGLQATGIGGLALFTPGVVNTVLASLANPIAVALDTAGNQYVLQSGTSAGTASLLLLPVGGGTPQTLMTASQGLVTPNSLSLDAAGDIFIGDSNQGTVTRFGADGTINPAYLTGLSDPVSLYVDSFNNLFIAQGGNAHNVVEAYLGGISRVLAGSGNDNTPINVLATSAAFVSPSSLTADLNGILYVADGGGHTVYAINQSGIIFPVAGNGTTATVTPGLATGTGLVNPAALAVDAAGDVYIADSGANIVYTVFVTASSSGLNIAPSLGTGTTGDTGDGGLATLAEINGPSSMAVDGSGNLFVVDGGNNALREISYPNPVLNFGTVIVGQASPILVQSISNLGTKPVTLASALGTSNPLFTIDPADTTCGNTIIVGSTCNVAFIFTPTQNGSVTATSTVVSNSSNSPQSITLTGTGKLVLPLTVTLVPQTEVYGQPFVESFTIANGNPPPTGTITFTTGSITLCTITATNGFPSSASCNAAASGLSVGTYRVTFTYSGDSNYAGISLPTTLTVTPAPLTVTVNNATRMVGTANPAFTGTVTGVVPGDIVLVSYSTSATISSPVGTYAITALLTTGGSTLLSNYIITNTPGVLTITAQTPTVTALTSSASTATVGTNITFTATVTASSVIPTGTVIFTNGSTILGQQTLDPSGTASFSTASLAVGTYTITATFQATASFGSSSASLTETINADPIGSFALASSPATQFLRGAGIVNYVITATSTGAFAGQIALTCSGLPADATCTFSSIPTLTPGGSAVTTMTITTTAADAKLRLPAQSHEAIAPLATAVVFPFELTGLTALFAGLRRRKISSRSVMGTKKLNSMRVHILTGLFLSLAMLGLTGCCAITSKTYIVTVNGSSLTFTAPSQTTSVILSVGIN